MEAIDQLTVKLQFGRYPYVVAADSKGFFDTLDQEWLGRRLAKRIDERAFRGLIRKWVRAGRLDTTGAILPPVTGTPQGGVVSPVMSNVYLHYVLDLWCEKVIKPQCWGEARLRRDADDYICAFESQAEAEGFSAAVGPRLAKFGLTLAPEKTRLLPCHCHQPPGQGRFEGLGVEWYWGRARAGKAPRKRRTARAKLWASLQRVPPWGKENRPRRLRELFTQLNGKLRGYSQYYGGHGKSASLQHFFDGVVRRLWKWLNRRSQRPSYTWQGFTALLEHFKVERPRIVGYPKMRKATALA